MTRAERYKAEREKALADSAAYYQAHREAILARRRAIYWADPAAQRARGRREYLEYFGRVRTTRLAGKWSVVGVLLVLVMAVRLGWPWPIPAPAVTPPQQRGRLHRPAGPTRPSRWGALAPPRVGERERVARAVKKYLTAGGQITRLPEQPPTPLLMHNIEEWWKRHNGD